MISLAEMAAVVVTRGDVELSEIEASLAPFGEVAVWDNSIGDDLAVYGRYAALAEVESDVVYVQDDDVILPLESLEALGDAYEPDVLVANMPARFRHDFYRDHCLVGFGAVFDRDLPRYAFDRFPVEEGTAFLRTCDIVFTALTPRKLVDVAYRDMPWSSAPGRMWTTAGHVEERTRMLELVRQVRDAS